jgi:hypothetical protein
VKLAAICRDVAQALSNAAMTRHDAYKDTAASAFTIPVNTNAFEPLLDRASDAFSGGEQPCGAVGLGGCQRFGDLEQRRCLRFPCR